ncbi:MAG: hypothetical protein AAGJ96_02475 [Pseudomonadota bacterium]
MSKPQEDAEAYDISLTNTLTIPLVLYKLDKYGRRTDPVQLDFVIPGKETDPDGHVPGSYRDVKAGEYLLATCGLTGGIVRAYAVTDKGSPSSITFSSNTFTEPNTVGDIPMPMPGKPVPADTSRVTVATAVSYRGTTSAINGIIVREQNWQLVAASCSLAPNERQEISYTVTHGRQTTSSTSEDVAAALGLSASVGWGFISTSINTSLNASASHSQEVSTSDETTVYVSQRVRNTGDTPVTYYRWQLYDTVTLFSPTLDLVASLSSALNPMLVSVVEDVLAPYEAASGEANAGTETAADSQDSSD